MRKFIAILILVAMAAALFASPSAQADLLPDGRSTQRFASELEAVIYAAALYNPQSIVSDTEVMGGVIKDNDGMFYFTVTIGKPGVSNIEAHIFKPVSHELVALWHTHGSSGIMHHAFSPVDVQQARRFGVPFYLANPDGELRVYRPGDKPETLKFYDRRTKLSVKIRRASLGTLICRTIDSTCITGE